jgi:hypothetical protein
MSSSLLFRVTENVQRLSTGTSYVLCDAARCTSQTSASRLRPFAFWYTIVTASRSSRAARVAAKTQEKLLFPAYAIEAFFVHHPNGSLPRGKYKARIIVQKGKVPPPICGLHDSGSRPQPEKESHKNSAAHCRVSQWQQA